ncbi:MAG TPA: methyl-accepting chemotaxis protein [Xanthobacteraceae bacterium]|jgi:methyl-accepting chemotaxis protein|nr:methyl-accepting chemotaxis protein [Xanthobacteraceae bacterium]
MKLVMPALRIGVRGRLWMAFGVISLLPIVAAAVSWWAFGLIGRSVDAVAGQALPRIEISLNLARQADRVVLAGANLADARNLGTFEAQKKLVEDEAAQVEALLEQLRINGVSGDRISTIKSTIAELRASTERTASFVKERIGADAQLLSIEQQVVSLAQRFSVSMEPLTTEQHSTTIGVAGEAARENMSSDERRVTQTRIRNIADGTRALGRMSASNAALQSAFAGIPNAQNLADLDRIAQNIRREMGTLESALDDLDDKPQKALGGLVEEWVKLGKVNATQVRRASLTAEQNRVTEMEASKKLAKDLASAIEAGVQASKKDADNTTAEARGVAASSKMSLFATAAVGLVLAVVIGWFYVGRNVVGRLLRLEQSMRALADGNLQTEVAKAGNDEIGLMAQALQVFKENAIETHRLHEEQRQEHAAKETRAASVDRLLVEFESCVKGRLGAVATAVSALDTTAESMAQVAEQTKNQASVSVHSAESTSSNVQAVAAAAEEMASTLGEISKQVVTSSNVARQAVREAEGSNDKVRGLADSTKKISDVVRLINEIAAQTKLLALNATIEAARAGESGRGFAVVAAEVKSLAAATERATEEIVTQVAAMQQATDSAVTAIQGIGGTIAQIDEAASSIAGAVEEQSATTGEIARNVQQAAVGSAEVSENIAHVSEAASQTGTAANSVLSAATELKRQSNDMLSEIERFIAGIRAA